ncbi:MAG: hypothetical protein PHV74_10760 [Dehalococcoidia bacterium]|nr:hypothetical protein [Dehalococcoidia bacterium]
MVWSVETKNLTGAMDVGCKTRKEELVQRRNDTLENLAEVKPHLAQSERERVIEAEASLRQMQTELGKLRDEVKTALAKAAIYRIQGEWDRINQTKAELKHLHDEIKVTLAKAMADVAQAERERIQQARERLARVQAELYQMQEQVRIALAKARTNLAEIEGRRIAGNKVDLEKRRATTQDRMSQVNGLLDECRGNREAAAAAWDKLAGIVMQQTPVTPDEPVRKNGDGASKLHDEVFNYLVGHHDGARMTELEERFGVPRIKMAMVLKSLMGDNKVQKQSKLYFAV